MAEIREGLQTLKNIPKRVRQAPASDSESSDDSSDDDGAQGQGEAFYTPGVAAYLKKYGCHVNVQEDFSSGSGSESESNRDAVSPAKSAPKKNSAVRESSTSKASSSNAASSAQTVPAEPRGSSPITTKPPPPPAPPGPMEEEVEEDETLVKQRLQNSSSNLTTSEQPSLMREVTSNPQNRETETRLRGRFEGILKGSSKQERQQCRRAILNDRELLSASKEFFEKFATGCSPGERKILKTSLAAMVDRYA
jgi:hypothetical protein